MAQIRVRPRTKETVLKDERGNPVPYDNGDGTVGLLVDENNSFWLRRIRDKDAVLVIENEEKTEVPAKAR